MKKMTQLMALVMALLMMCTAALAEAKPDDVMATVNGQKVTRAQYEEYLGQLVQYYSSNYGVDTSDETILVQLRSWALQTAVEYAVMDQKIVELNMQMTDEQKKAVEDSAKAQWEAEVAAGMEYYGVTDTSTEDERARVLVQVLAELESWGYTEESYIAESLKYAPYQLLQDHITQNVMVSEQEVQEYINNLIEADKANYEGNVTAYEQMLQMNQLYAMYGMTDYVTDVYYMPSGYRAVNHILLIPDDAALVDTYNELLATYEEQQLTLEEGGEVTDALVTAEQVDAAAKAIMAAVQPTIDEIQQKLKDGANFNDLIPLYGEDPGMYDAAAIAEGYAVHFDSIMWDPAFTNAAMSIEKVGGVSEPVVGMNGVHIVHYDHDMAGGPIEITDELTAKFVDLLYSNKQSEAYNEQMNQWVGQAKIEYSEEGLSIVGAIL